MDDLKWMGAVRIIVQIADKNTIKHRLQVKTLNMLKYYLWIIVRFLISCLNSHSDGTHSLQSIHWWASDVMLIFSKICSDEDTNSSTS